MNKTQEIVQQQTAKQADSKDLAKRYLELMKARHARKNKKQFTNWLNK